MAAFLLLVTLIWQLVHCGGNPLYAVMQLELFPFDQLSSTELSQAHEAYRLIEALHGRLRYVVQ